ncbi:MAG: tripartite tricarboxylate transporter permease [Syntrophorhabdaceae bacterium]|nr:tripartite tricarboxylate transporter permease [Syntrophorhabdaceae bacterium]
MVELLNAFISGLTQIFTFSTFMLMLVGIAIGFIVGILPGLGGPATIALMLPFIVKMNAVEAFAILLGMASVLGTTGDITSILFGVPGEPTAAATILDGHPMAKKGEAGRALGAVLMSSLVGAIFGAFVLALFVPIVRPLVLTFSSPELFMLAVLGLTFIASLSGGAMLKALLGAGIGLFLSTVGMDPQTGIQRFTFGQVFLWDGVGLVPITMGFFAIPEIIDLGIHRSSIAKEKVKKIGGVIEGVKDTFRHIWLVIKCSAIGTFCAIIPGLGPAVSQWLAYAQAQQSAKDKSRFGKGAVEGVLGPGASNNSSMGGSLITTVAFGIPASVLMAILIGAFLIQGLVPGPDMLIPDTKGGHLSLTFSFVWIIVISNIITVGICLLFLNQLVKVTYVRGSVIIPIILLLVYLGTFAEKNAFPDIILMLFFGVLGWVMERLGWPRPPFILGLVLGNLAETRLFLAVDSYGASWLLRPAVIVIMALTFAGVLIPILRSRRKGKTEEKEGVTEKEQGDRTDKKALGIRFTWSAAFSLFIIIVFAWALWYSRKFTFTARFFPMVIGIPVLIFAIIQFILDLTGKGKKVVEEVPGGEHEFEAKLPQDVVNRRTAGVFAWTFGWFLGIWLFGFNLGAPLCTFIQLKLGEREKWVLSLALTFVVWAFVYLVFDRFLNVPFPKGQFFLWTRHLF